MVSLRLPPGPRFLLAHLPRALVPPALVLLLARYAVPSAPLWLALALSVLSLPLAFVANVTLLEWRDARNAKRLGAVMPPMIAHRLPGAVDLLKDMRRDNEGKFPGACLLLLLGGDGCS